VGVEFAGYFHLGCSDLARTAAFYARLGLNILEEGDELLLADSGGLRIWPLPVSGEGADLRFGEAVVVFYCDDVLSEHKRLVDEGTEILCAPSRPFGSWEMHLRDPDGLWVMLIERPAVAPQDEAAVDPV
jgi:catechol 2,3-dioxygenase-like lactoylglutathione lyase family enzyme